MDSSTNSQPELRSYFVTVLAWVFLVITGFSTFISVLQNIMITFFFPMAEMEAGMHSAKGSENLPAFVQFMLGHMQYFFLAFLLLSATMFISSVALLKRKNWARIAFIVFLAFGIAWNIGSLFFQSAFFSSMSQMPSDAPSEFRAQVESMAMVMLVAMSLFAIAFSALFAWLIKRLASPRIRAEFHPRAL